MSTTDTTGPKGLLGALLAFQAEAPTLPKDATNPHFRSKYTPLDTIVERIRPLLAKHGLTWSTFPSATAQGDPALRYVLAHAETGETAEGVMPLLVTKRDPQGQGSAITYARRYAICAVLNLVADEDDDGNGATAPRAPAAQAPTQAPATTVDKDAGRPAAPPIPRDRAQAILDAAVAANLAKVADGQAPEFGPVFKAKLATLGVDRIGLLNVDQAEDVETFIRQEASA